MASVDSRSKFPHLLFRYQVAKLIPYLHGGTHLIRDLPPLHRLSISLPYALNSNMVEAFDTKFDGNFDSLAPTHIVKGIHFSTNLAM